jgi:hypothetical protein
MYNNLSDSQGDNDTTDQTWEGEGQQAKTKNKKDQRKDIGTTLSEFYSLITEKIDEDEKEQLLLEKVAECKNTKLYIALGLYYEKQTRGVDKIIDAYFKAFSESTIIKGSLVDIYFAIQRLEIHIKKIEVEKIVERLDSLLRKMQSEGKKTPNVIKITIALILLIDLAIKSPEGEIKKCCFFDCLYIIKEHFLSLQPTIILSPTKSDNDFFANIIKFSDIGIGGCALIISSTFTSDREIELPDEAMAAYIFAEDKLFYFNKLMKKIIPIEINVDEIEILKKQLDLPERHAAQKRKSQCVIKELSNEQLGQFQIIAKHRHGQDIDLMCLKNGISKFKHYVEHERIHKKKPKEFADIKNGLLYINEPCFKAYVDEYIAGSTPTRNYTIRQPLLNTVCLEQKDNLEEELGEKKSCDKTKKNPTLEGDFVMLAFDQATQDENEDNSQLKEYREVLKNLYETYNLKRKPIPFHIFKNDIIDRRNDWDEVWHERISSKIHNYNIFHIMANVEIKNKEKEEFKKFFSDLIRQNENFCTLLFDNREYIGNNRKATIKVIDYAIVKKTFYYVELIIENMILQIKYSNRKCFNLDWLMLANDRIFGKDKDRKKDFLESKNEAYVIALQAILNNPQQFIFSDSDQNIKFFNLMYNIFQALAESPKFNGRGDKPAVATAELSRECASIGDLKVPKGRSITAVQRPLSTVEARRPQLLIDYMEAVKAKVIDINILTGMFLDEISLLATEEISLTDARLRPLSSGESCYNEKFQSVLKENRGLKRKISEREKQLSKTETQLTKIMAIENIEEKNKKLEKLLMQIKEQSGAHTISNKKRKDDNLGNNAQNPLLDSSSQLRTPVEQDENKGKKREREADDKNEDEENNKRQKFPPEKFNKQSQNNQLFLRDDKEQNTVPRETDDSEKGTEKERSNFDEESETAEDDELGREEQCSDNAEEDESERKDGLEQESNSALKIFMGDNSSNNRSHLEFTTWYHPDICHYLLHMVHNQSQCLRVLFDDSGFDYNIDSFKKQLLTLIILSNESNKPAVFISKEPGANNHFICGLVNANNILFINPLGISSHHEFYQTLAELQKKVPINIWLSSSSLQNELHEENLVSCGPIAVELAIHILEKYSLEGLMKFWGSLGTAEPSDHKASGLRYYGMPIQTLLPDSLRPLLDSSTSTKSYQNSICCIRERHRDLLRGPSTQRAEEEQKSVNEYLEKYGADSPDQVYFNKFLMGHNLETLEATAYQLLPQELSKAQEKHGVAQLSIDSVTSESPESLCSRDDSTCSGYPAAEERHNDTMLLAAAGSSPQSSTFLGSSNVGETIPRNQVLSEVSGHVSQASMKPFTKHPQKKQNNETSKAARNSDQYVSEELVDSTRSTFSFFKHCSKRDKGKQNIRLREETEKTVEQCTPAIQGEKKQGYYAEYQAYLFFINYYAEKYGTSPIETSYEPTQSLALDTKPEGTKSEPKKFKALSITGTKEKESKKVTIAWFNRKDPSQQGNRDLDIQKRKMEDLSYKKEYYVDVKSHKTQGNAGKCSYTRSQTELILKVQKYKIYWLASDRPPSLSEEHLETIICQITDDKKHIQLNFINTDGKLEAASISLDEKDEMYLNYLLSVHQKFGDNSDLIEIKRDDNKPLFNKIFLECKSSIKTNEHYRICEVINLVQEKDDMQFNMRTPPFSDEDELRKYTQEFRMGFNNKK